MSGSSGTTMAEAGTRVLIVEDVRSDYDLMRLALGRGGLDFVTHCVETEPEFREALQEFKPDVILADHSLPRFAGMTAFLIVEELNLDTPVILVSGGTTEDIALEYLRVGFADYVLKDNLLRLGSAVTATVESWRSRRERQKVEGEIRRSQARLSALVDGALDGIIVTDSRGAVLSFNTAALAMYGYSLAEVRGRPIRDLMSPPWVAGRNEDSAENDIETGFGNLVGGRQEVLAQRSDGTTFPVELSAVRLETGGEPVFAGFLRDLSAQKAAEQSVRRSQIILSEASVMLALLDRGHTYLSVNRAYLKAFGKTEEQVLGHTARDVLGQEGFDFVRPHAERCMEGQEVRFDAWLDLPSGRRYLSVTYSPYRNEHDEIQGFVVNAQDITDLLHAEEERKLLAAAVEYAAEGVLVADTDGIIQYVNPAFESLSGYSSEEVVGKDRHIFESGRHDRSFYDDIRKSLERGEVWAGRLLSVKKDGTHYEADATISPVRNNERAIVNYVGVGRDTTHEVELEAQLVHGRRMEAVGRLAGGIAHDFNNILAAAAGFTQLARESVASDSEAFDHMSQVAKACERATALVSQLLAFSRGESTERKPIKVAGVIEEALSLLRKAIPTTISFDVDIRPDLGAVLADPTQIHQVVMNLGLNAYHAMREGGGTLSVRVDEKRLEEGIPSSGRKAGRYLRITISDTGCGMDDPTMQRVFEPYFTTKEVEEGSGLGLATVLGIVEEHQGTVGVRSVLGEGSAFEVCLPLHLGAEDGSGDDERSPGENDATRRGNGEHVLLVDDEPAVLSVMGAMLQGLGYAVTMRPDGREALDTFRADPDLFDLVITDQAMPGLTGLEMGKEMLRVRPRLPILLCTGFSDTASPRDALADGMREYLMKPVTAAHLARQVRLALDESGPATTEGN